MTFLRNNLSINPALPRVVPFILFLVLTSLQGTFGEESRYWLYLAKTVLGAWMIWVIRPLIAEMRWSFSWEAVVAGIGVFVIWVGLEPFNPFWNELFGKSSAEPSLAWNPNQQFGDGSALALLFIIVRIAGSALVVPPLEEVFYRSFVYRWIIRPDIQQVPLNQFDLKAFLLTALVFGIAHPHDWLAGILCAMAYQYLVLRKNRLGDAITAHAITNLLLGIWVVWRGEWKFW